MGAIKNWVIQKFLLGYVKDLLDKVPGNGIKTALGVLLYVLDVLKPFYIATPYGVYIAMAIEFIDQLSPVPFKDISLGVAITGVVHKVLKYFGKDVPPDAPVLIQ